METLTMNIDQWVSGTEAFLSERSAETWRQDLPAPSSGANGEVRLLYRSNPYLPDDESIELGRVTLGS